jgi:HEAT repeat protein
VIEAGAARGLAELADPRGFALLRAALESSRGTGLRAAAVRALARLAVLVDDVRTVVVAALEQSFRDPAYSVRIGAYAACQTLADARLLPALDRLALAEHDGRLRRDAAEAALRVREALTVPREIATLRDQIGELQLEARKLREALDEVQRT